MSAECRALPWDSEFFGFPIARVESPTIAMDDLEGIDDWCRSKGIRCLYLSVPADDREAVRAAEAGGFRLVDVRIDLERGTAPAGERPEPPADATFRPGRAEDGDRLAAIAAVGFEASRYYFDEGFGPGPGRALFETWIRNSLSGYADAVIVAALGEVPCGFVTCHLEGEDAARIGLLGVGENARGMRLGGSLVAEALDRAARDGRTRMRVATQARNVAALRLYERAGFATRDVRVFYHGWYGGTDGR